MKVHLVRLCKIKHVKTQRSQLIFETRAMRSLRIQEEKYLYENIQNYKKKQKRLGRR